MVQLSATGALDALLGPINRLLGSGTPGELETGIPGIGKIRGDQIRWFAEAVKVAKKYDLPETEFIRLLWGESKLDTNAYGNGGGLGQIMPETAAGYGYTQEQLRADPKLNLDLAGRLIQDNGRALGITSEDAQGFDKVAAAYYLGSGSIQEAIKKGGTNWLAEADKIAERYPQNGKIVTATQYLAKVGVGSGTPTRGGATVDSTGKYTVPPGTVPEPNYNDFLESAGGDHAIAAQGYYPALNAYNQIKRQHASDIGAYLEIVSAELTAEISAGNLDLNKATAEFNRRMDAFRYGGDLFEKLQPYTIREGSQYLPGHEPGGVFTQMGRPVLAANPTPIDPFAMAQNIINQTPSPMSIPTPSTAKLGAASTMFEQALIQARGGAPLGSPQTPNLGYGPDPRWGIATGNPITIS